MTALADWIIGFLMDLPTDELKDLRMTHAYITLDALKSEAALNITGTANDDRLLGLAEAASSVIDRWCNRHFFALKATLRFDGSGAATLGVPDLVSVDSEGVRIYERGFGGFPTTWTADDYRLLPYDADPASPGNSNSRPYTRLLATGAKSGRLCFPPGRSNVEVSGVWGWWKRLRRASQLVDAAADAAATTLELSALENGRATLAAGHALLIGDEQVYVRGRDGETLTVQRGVNGTVAAAIDKDSPIDIYEYPAPVSEAALRIAARLWQDARGGVDDWQAGSVGMDPDIGLLLSPYRKPALGVF